MGAGHVFVSYTSADRPFADELVRAVETCGLRVWYAPRDVRPGMDYSEQIHKAIETASTFVVIVSDASNGSKFVRAETEMAFSFDRPIFPVRTSLVTPARGLALFLRLRHWTDAFGPLRQNAIKRLVDELLAARDGSTGSRRHGSTLFRPRIRRTAKGQPSKAAPRRYAPFVLFSLGGVALILAFALVPGETEVNPLTGDPQNSVAGPRSANNAGDPDYDPLREDWVRHARETAPPPPPPPEEFFDNATDVGTDVDMNMAAPDATNEVNGM